MRLPEGSQAPRLFQFLNWVFRPLDTLDDRVRKYGETFRVLRDTLPPTIYVSSPDALQTLFTAEPECFDSGRQNRPLKVLLGDRSLILTDGDYHKRQRKLLMPPFHGDRLRSYGELICHLTLEVLQEKGWHRPFPLRSAMQSISLRVILNAVFGLHEGDRYQEMERLLSALVDAVGSPLRSLLLFYPSLQRDWGAWSPWGRFLRHKQQIDALLYAEIGDRRDRPDPSRTDILTLLLAARDEDGQPMTDEELRDELLTLLFAGHETTASALAWALYWIHYLPEVQQHLLAELDALPADATPAIVAKLPYLSAVCQETLRLYPIALNGFPRILKQPMEVAGYSLPTGTAIIPSIYLAHRRQQVYPEPEQFRPERFLERQFSPYEYLPFGGGNRLCIGQAFALFEMKLAIATLLSNFELGLVRPRPVKPVRRGLTIAPPASLQMVVKAPRQLAPTDPEVAKNSPLRLVRNGVESPNFPV
ncbi:MAG: cytochrome P450 [Chloroflexaceae bacterium]|nr:cytochrome P450 [Chloroflexaceae bacterium]